MDQSKKKATKKNRKSKGGSTSDEEHRLACGGRTSALPLSKQPDYEKGRTIEPVRKRPHVKSRPFKAASQTVQAGGTNMMANDGKEMKVKKVKKEAEPVPVYPNLSGQGIRAVNKHFQFTFFNDRATVQKFPKIGTEYEIEPDGNDGFNCLMLILLARNEYPERTWATTKGMRRFMRTAASKYKEQCFQDCEIFQNLKIKDKKITVEEKKKNFFKECLESVHTCNARYDKRSFMMEKFNDGSEQKGIS